MEKHIRSVLPEYKQIKSTCIISNSWQQYSVLNRAKGKMKVISVRFIDSGVFLDLVKMGWGVLSLDALVDQVWLEKAVSFRNKLEKKRGCFPNKKGEPEGSIALCSLFWRKVVTEC